MTHLLGYYNTLSIFFKYQFIVMTDSSYFIILENLIGKLPNRALIFLG